MSRHLEQLIRVYASDQQPLHTELDQTLKPRGPELLYEVAARYIQPNNLMLDVGCRDVLSNIENLDRSLEADTVSARSLGHG
jgi:tRNA U34 5-methylaminomethyl-2-thiouridine-forming methyltransferase MnmC